MSEGSKYNTTVKEAMEILGKSRRTIYRKLRSGEIDAKKVSTEQTVKWMINEDDLYQNKMIQESVDVEEVERRVPKKELLEELKEVLGNEEVLNEQTDLLHKILNEVREENKKLRQDKNQLLRDVKKLEKENKELKQKIEELEDQSLADHVKNIFKN